MHFRQAVSCTSTALTVLSLSVLLFLEIAGLASRYDSEYVSTRIGMYTNNGRHYISSSASVGHTCDKLRANVNDELLTLRLPSLSAAALRLHVDQRRCRFRTRVHRAGRCVQQRITVISRDRVRECEHQSSMLFAENNLTSDRETTYLHHVLLFTLQVVKYTRLNYSTLSL